MKRTDLATDPAYADVLAQCADQMAERFSVEAVAARVEAFHNEQVERLGGVQHILDNWPSSPPYSQAPAGFG